MDRHHISAIVSIGLLGLSSQSAFAFFEPDPVPIPEPSALALLAIGGAAYGLIQLRRNRKKK